MPHLVPQVHQRSAPRRLLRTRLPDPLLRASHHNQVQHLAHAMSHNLCAREAGNRLGGAVPQRNAATLIRQGNALRQTVQRRFQQLRAVHVARSFHSIHRRKMVRLDSDPTAATGAQRQM